MLTANPKANAPLLLLHSFLQANLMLGNLKNMKSKCNVYSYTFTAEEVVWVRAINAKPLELEVCVPSED